MPTASSDETARLHGNSMGKTKHENIEDLMKKIKGVWTHDLEDISYFICMLELWDFSFIAFSLWFSQHLLYSIESHVNSKSQPQKTT